LSKKVRGIRNNTHGKNKRLVQLLPKTLSAAYMMNNLLTSLLHLNLVRAVLSMRCRYLVN